MSVCISDCKKMFDCKHHAINNEGSHDAVDWANYGSGRWWYDGYTVEYYCGELGNYALFKAKKTPEIFDLSDNIIQPPEELNDWIESAKRLMRNGKEKENDGRP